MLIALTMVSLAGLTKYDITLTRSWRFCSCNVKKKEPLIISIFNFINKQLLLYSKKRDISFLYWLINRADQQSDWMTNWLTIDWLAVDWLIINIDFLIKLKIIMWHLILWTPPKQHDFTYNIIIIKVLLLESLHFKEKPCLVWKTQRNEKDVSDNYAICHL